jgi:hypothetical protein
VGVGFVVLARRREVGRAGAPADGGSTDFAIVREHGVYHFMSVFRKDSPPASLAGPGL